MNIDAELAALDRLLTTTTAFAAAGQWGEALDCLRTGLRQQVVPPEKHHERRQAPARECGTAAPVEYARHRHQPLRATPALARSQQG